MTAALARGGVDRVCSVLGHRHRRQVLRCLEDERAEMTTDELAREIAHACEYSESSRRTLTALRHVHLPKLADEDAIRYDSDDGVVSSTRLTGWFLECLNSIENQPL